MAEKNKIKTIAMGAAFALIGIVVLFEVAAAVIPTAQTAGNTLNATGIPLGSFFVSDGLTFLLISVGVFIAVVIAALQIGGKSK